ncbi:MAG: hypothetical protein AB7O39_00500 [Flavobacteriaceae bacterium]
MEDDFFVHISYECEEDGSVEINVETNGLVATRNPSRFRSGSTCYDSFRSPSPMLGELIFTLKENGQSHSTKLELRRKLTLYCPVLDMIMSV